MCNAYNSQQQPYFEFSSKKNEKITIECLLEKKGGLKVLH